MQFSYTILSDRIGVVAVDAAEMSIIERFRQQHAMPPTHPPIAVVEARPTNMRLVSGTLLVNPWLKRSVLQRWRGASDLSKSLAYDEDRALEMTRDMMHDGVTCFTTSDTEYRYLTVRKSKIFEDERVLDTIPFVAYIEAEECFPLVDEPSRCLHVTPLQCNKCGPYDPMTCVMNRPFMMLLGHQQTVSMDVAEQRGDILYDAEILTKGVNVIRRILRGHGNDRDL